MTAAALPMWTIYHNPKDYPGMYVVRRALILAGVVQQDPVAYVTTTLADARRAVPAGLFNLGRSPGDEPQIVEVWV